MVDAIVFNGASVLLIEPELSKNILISVLSSMTSPVGVGVGTGVAFGVDANVGCGVGVGTGTCGVVAGASMWSRRFAETETSALAAGQMAEQACATAYRMAFAVAATAAMAGAILAWTMRRST